tara:strand:- start:129 stop:443 length:315 start_codon:yes stop_codon:yes gene_type:complete
VWPEQVEVFAPEYSPESTFSTVVGALATSCYFWWLATISDMHDEATYICDHCGEEIVVPIDPTAGSHQQYVEDCPVCCNPHVIHVEIDADGMPRVWGAAEQDRF